jgi:hypothetical protein
MTRGEITHIGKHSDGKHATLTIKHGTRKPQPRKGPGAGLMSNYDDRPESQVHVPLRKAKKYALGQTGTVGFRPTGAAPASGGIIAGAGAGAGAEPDADDEG